MGSEMCIRDRWLINKYDQALKVFMDKSPTQVKFGQKIKQPEAMDLIKTRDVIEKIELLIKRQS